MADCCAAACCSATCVKAAFAASRATTGRCWLRCGLLRREAALLGFFEFDVVTLLTLFALVDGTLGPSRVLPGPVRYCVLRDSWLRLRLRRPGLRSSRSNELAREFARELARELACERWYSGSSPRSM